MRKKDCVYKWQQIPTLSLQIFPQNTSGSPYTYMQMVLSYDFLNSRRFRTDTETRGNLLKGMPEIPDRKRDGQLALENFPNNFDIWSQWLSAFLCPFILPWKFRNPYMTSEYSDLFHISLILTDCIAMIVMLLYILYFAKSCTYHFWDNHPVRWAE